MGLINKGEIFLKIQKVISEIYSKIEELQRDVRGMNLEFTYCFRGEARDYGETRLVPTLFRENTLDGKLPDKELINLISDYRIADPSIKDSLSKAIEGQHFLALSRLLDITFSILPSIFFASLYEKKEDGVVYIFQFPKTYSPSSLYINAYYDKLISGEITPYYQNFKVLSHTQSNERIKSQSGGFILFPGPKIKKIPKEYFREVKIKSEDKEEIIEELNNFFNINESIMYPEKDKKRDVIKKKLYMISGDREDINDSKKFYKSEIRNTIERIKYESTIAMSRLNQENSLEANNTLKRILRKEEYDLIGYIDSINSEVLGCDKKKLKDEISFEFKKWFSLL